MSRNVLVTGGAGFIGSSLVDELTSEGCRVFVADNLSSGKREHARIPDDRFLPIDVLDASSLAGAIREVAPVWVIHLAAIHFIPYCNAHPYESSNINLKGTLNVLDALRAVPSVRKVFFASTMAVYADSPVPVTEDSPAVPLDIYGLTKLVGERLVREFHLGTKVPCVIGRLSNAYGPRETNPHLIPEIFRQVQEGGRVVQLGNIATRRDYIHTSDMVRAIFRLMRADGDGVDVYNIGAGQSYTASDAVRYFERALDCKLDVVVASDRVRKNDRALLQADISKIRAAIDWEPKMNFEDGIKALVRGDV